MNTKRIAGVIIALAVIGGAITVFGVPNAGSPPFDISENNTTQNSSTTVSFDGVTDEGRLTQEAIALNTIKQSNTPFRVSFETSEQGSTTTENILFSPTQTYTAVSIDTEPREERFYTSRYTAVKEYQGDGYSYDLVDSQVSVGPFVKEPFLNALTESIGLTVQQSSLGDGDNEIVFRGDSLRQNPEQSSLTTYYAVDQIIRVDEARLITNQSGYVSEVELSLYVESNNERYSIDSTYTLERREGASVEEPTWVNEAYDSNVGATAFIPEDNQMYVTHKYGRTLGSGDQIRVQTPSGSLYTATVEQAITPGTTVVIYENESGTYMEPRSQNMSIDGRPIFESSGVYTVTIVSNGEGVVEVTTTRRASS